MWVHPASIAFFTHVDLDTKERDRLLKLRNKLEEERNHFMGIVKRLKAKKNKADAGIVKGHTAAHHEHQEAMTEKLVIEDLEKFGKVTVVMSTVVRGEKKRPYVTKAIRRSNPDHGVEYEVDLNHFEHYLSCMCAARSCSDTDT